MVGANLPQPPQAREMCMNHHPFSRFKLREVINTSPVFGTRGGNRRGEKVRVRMRFVIKPGSKRGSWHAEFFPYETMQSQFMREAEARAQGYRPTRSGQ